MLVQFDIKNISADLFSSTAEKIAESIAAESRANSKLNKSTQIRKFYDEVVVWYSKVGNDNNVFDDCLPFIKMISSKVAYAKGRELVGDNFLEFINTGLRQIETLAEFRNFKLLFEAVLGYYKALRPKD